MKRRTVCQCIQERNASCWELQAKKACLHTSQCCTVCRPYMTAPLKIAVHDHVATGLLGGGGIMRTDMKSCKDAMRRSCHHACRHVKMYQGNKQYLASCPSAHRSRCVLRCLASQRPHLHTPPPCLGCTSCRPSCSSAHATRHSLHGTCNTRDQCRFMQMCMLYTCVLTKSGTKQRQHDMNSVITTAWFSYD